ncbi:HEAT repeat domain-containing protein [Polyangium sp. 15x6]|uniref:HEAT repeat domain-containing protein n=1 Tax=Polyangium sp. 15x6 TaxID=3042687 RepID=UPI00249AD7C7|nr:HEAT repeat domain-containing protein [Polyangium sp. 15x6]MDI3283775.1 HEAT repeat domain-containing protein [Polyangium sp. 15x6]
MFDVSSLCWTSRDEVGERLLSALELPGCVGLRAARLLALLAPPSLAAALTRIAADPARSFWHRGYALRALARASIGLPDETFARLLDEVLVDNPAAPLAELFPFARSGARLAALLARFDRATPAARRAWLATMGRLADHRCEEIEAWLVARWIEDVARTSPDDEDASLAVYLAEDHPDVLDVLAAYFRDRPQDPELFEDIRLFPDLAHRLDDETRAAAAAALVLPRRDLLRRSSIAELRRAARKAVLDHNFARFCPIDKPRTSYGYRGALAFLEEDENGPAMAANLLARARLHEALRADLGLVLHRRRRRVAVQYLERRGADPENLELARALLREIAKNPDTRDRAALLAALHFPDPEARFLALDVLDAVAENGPTFRAALESLAEDPDPFVRLRVTGALACRGHASHMQTLVEAARASANATLRALAIRLLGMLDEARDHFALFERALLEDHAAEEPDGPTPTVEQAAFALGSVFGPEATTALLRGLLLAPSNASLDVVEAALSVILDEMEGAPLTTSARRQEITLRDGGRCTSWSPLRSPGWWW